MELGTVRLESGEWQARVEEHEEFGGLAAVFRLADRPGDVMLSALPPEGAPAADGLAALARDPEVRWWSDPRGGRWMVRLEHGPRPGHLSFESLTLNQWIRSVEAPAGTHLGELTDAELERYWAAIAKP